MATQVVAIPGQECGVVPLINISFSVRSCERYERDVRELGPV